MILALAAKRKKTFACTMLALMYFEMIIPPATSQAAVINPAYRKENNYPATTGVANTAPVAKPMPVATPIVAKDAEKNTFAPEKAEGGPGQPEMAEFHSVNSDNMVDLFSGDLSYSIPLMDVGGYPIAIGYNSGITMDQEASWVGLGWSLNPGVINRNLRGVPDEFNGADTLTKTQSIRESKTIGGNLGIDLELAGRTQNIGGKDVGTDAVRVSLSASLGIVHNTYKGIGIEMGTAVGLRVAKGQASGLSGGLGFTNSSQNGLTISPSVGYSIQAAEYGDKGNLMVPLSVGTALNTREGMKSVQFSAGTSLYRTNEKNTKANGEGNGMTTTGRLSGAISFASPSFNPAMSVPYTSTMLTISAKVGAQMKIVHPSLSLGGYIAKQGIEPEDQVMRLPAYGYLNYQHAEGNPLAVLDYNREKDASYRDRDPQSTNIAIPIYTYDVFSILGEGVSGSFRGYRSDVGYVYDHKLKTKDKSLSIGADVGFGDIVKIGVDVNYTRSFTETLPWTDSRSNPLASSLAFTKGGGLVEPSYFRNPGEKTVNTKAFYDLIGGEDIVVPKLFQAGADIRTLNTLTTYKDGRFGKDVALKARENVKENRDKRTQVITYMTAKEASVAGQSPYLENYQLNKFMLQNDCAVNTGNKGIIDEEEHGLLGEYFEGRELDGKKFMTRIDTGLHFKDVYDFKFPYGVGSNKADAPPNTVRWTGRIKAPVTGVYQIITDTDDGVRVFMNGESLINGWWTGYGIRKTTVNLEAGQMYDLRVELFNWIGDTRIHFTMFSGETYITAKDFYTPAIVHDTFTAVPDFLTNERRITSMRKANHISQVEVLSPDGKRNIYGLPVYNIKQKETTFAVKHENGNPEDGSVAYNHGVDNTVGNKNGTDWYFSSEETPAYPTAFLLTGIMSPDYVDLTGNGISDDDPGNAVKFNYTKTAGKDNPFKWRTPYSKGANYNEGMKSDNRDDKGSYVYGEKELWYLNSIESKNMVATFVLADRYDQQPIDENGNKGGINPSKRLEEINLYTKADFLKYNTAARPIKTVHFEYNYQLCKGYSNADSTGKLTLTRIWFTYNGNKKGKKNAYVFNYNAVNPDYDHKSADRWGNYKNPADNFGYSENNKITNGENPYAVQDSALAATNIAAWTLDEITLPSGGRMKITYESDDYGFVQHTRAARMFNIAGFSREKPVITEKPFTSNLTPTLYESAGDNAYVAINVPESVSSKEEVYTKYLTGLDDMMSFRLNVKMPTDKWGSGYEFINVYAVLEPGEYGYTNGGRTIWFKVKTVNDKGKLGGDLTPMARMAAQFLRLHAPSKAYPGSDVGDNPNVVDALQMFMAQADNILNALRSFDATVRSKKWMKYVDLNRSFVRLNVPDYKKYGNGHRVKRIVIYDNWNKMTGRKESMYGTEYEYTRTMKIDGVERKISSGVATYEPMVGAEENPLRKPIAYGDRSALWAPVDISYMESPVAESFYPGASVGYSAVISRSINNDPKIKSRTGFKENLFYTAYDFPTFSDQSIFDATTKKVYKPTLNNLFKINARHYLTLSQGFKVELNDMHGKPKAENIYGDADKTPNSYTRYFYRVANDLSAEKRLSNTVLTMDAKGNISTDLTIGEDVELMMDMRQSRMETSSMAVEANLDIFFLNPPIPFGLPMVIPIPQSEKNQFRSVAAMKVINRHGIMDSVEVMDKGSKVVTRNLLYDGETGDVILTSTQNEFGDPVFNFSYPAGWMYEGMSGAYKNVNASLDHVYLQNGKIIGGLTPGGISDGTINSLFFSGDEILAYGRNKVNDDECNPVPATFPNAGMLWVVNANELSDGVQSLYFIDENGKPYTGNDVTLKVIRSGRRNMNAGAGSVTMMKSPLDLAGNGKYILNINKDKKIISASMIEYKQNWQVQDRKKQKILCAY
ncbi:PA14 domain-containing protein [Chitinophaga agri]|uniref:PA14 domain-containing protein n=1 Tax=Chitinophaga agri TaxID=2703787 RepID=A0A6B9Z982_9BACT|nr:PA14 domain-containing protein [Chitinophaga agri]QHS58597.1 hypothetical protein GWR21_02990 [Chitinophaga agri]